VPHTPKTNKKKQMPEADIAPADGLPSLAALPAAAASPADADADAHAASTAALLAKTAVLKLNGGLGTSMGLEKAKSLLEVKGGHTFLDLIALQVKALRARYAPARVRFILMDSFATSADTRALLKERHPELEREAGWELLQNKSPKVDAATLAPARWPAHAEAEWCPPGHGDIYPSLLGSGMLDALLADGVEYLFVSNSDNLGATLDLALLRHFAAAAAAGGGGGSGGGQAFVMEVCERTAADKKGGHLAVRKADGKFVLRESAMCPGESFRWWCDGALCFFACFFFFCLSKKKKHDRGAHALRLFLSPHAPPHQPHTDKKNPPPPPPPKKNNNDDDRRRQAGLRGHRQAPLLQHQQPVGAPPRAQARARARRGRAAASADQERQDGRPAGRVDPQGVPAGDGDGVG
jgi:hypothetical protein